MIKSILKAVLFIGFILSIAMLAAGNKGNNKVDYCYVPGDADYLSADCVEARAINNLKK